MQGLFACHQFLSSQFGTFSESLKKKKMKKKKDEEEEEKRKKNKL